MTEHRPSRPDWTHPEVKTAAVREVYEDIKQWALRVGAIPDDVDDKELRAVVTLAVIETADPYDTGRYLEDFVGWPVNGELVRLLDIAFRRMHYLVKEVVHDWVMKHKVRFPAKKDHYVRFNVGDVEVSGVVVGVVSTEAAGFVEFGPASDRKTLRVNAEDVTGTAPPRKKRPGSGRPPPQGGTPLKMAVGE